MIAIFFRTLIIYVFIMFTLHLMGKRQLGELDLEELVSTLLISEIAALPIADPDIPLLNAVIPILLILVLEIIISSVKNKSAKLKSIIEGNPVFIIYKGKLMQREMKKNRISLNELMCEARVQGIFDIFEIEYAILEQNGKISFMKNGSNDTFSRAVIIDGELREQTATRLKLKRADIMKILKKNALTPEEVFLMTFDDNSKCQIIKKDAEDGKGTEKETDES